MRKISYRIHERARTISAAVDRIFTGSLDNMRLINPRSYYYKINIIYYKLITQNSFVHSKLKYNMKQDKLSSYILFESTYFDFFPHF